MSEICILYCLTKREMTIYSVKKYIIDIFGAFTRPSHGTIHPSLKKLLSQNYVSVRDVLSSGGKKSSYYSITDKGKKYLTELLLSDLSDNPSMLMNDIYIRLISSSYLHNENKKILLNNIIKTFDLHMINIQRILENEYSHYDEFQKSVLTEQKKQSLSLFNFVKDIKV